MWILALGYLVGNDEHGQEVLVEVIYSVGGLTNDEVRRGTTDLKTALRRYARAFCRALAQEKPPSAFVRVTLDFV